MKKDLNLCVDEKIINFSCIILKYHINNVYMIFYEHVKNTRDFSHEMNRTTSKNYFKNKFSIQQKYEKYNKKYYTNKEGYVRKNSTSKNWKLKYVSFVHSHVIGWLELHT